LYRAGRALSAKPLGIAEESFGRRVAKQRAELGWTQSQLAERVGLSRVALSHIEANLSVPSERTVTLLAGVFGCEPCALAAGTDYPPAKAERLPLVTARHTEVDHQLAVLDAVLATVARVPAPDRDRLAAEVRAEWRDRLADLLAASDDPGERHRVRAARDALAR
jgi:transcriptional regulator with XRE-family HTH domain